MAKQVIHLYGASGAGTSTLGKFISEKLGFYFMDTDDYFWLPTNPLFTEKRKPSERLALMKADIEKYGNVVIAGSLTDWGDELIPLFTLAIRVNTDKQTRIERLKNREREQFGSRIDAGGDMCENHREFIEWASSYDNGGLKIRSRAKHDEWQKLLTCERIEVNGTDSFESNLKMAKQFIIPNS